MRKVMLVIFFLFFSAISESSEIKRAIKEDNITKLKKYDLQTLSYLYRDELGRNTLASSIASNSENIVSYLIESKVGLDVRDYLGRSPLMLALLNNDSDVAKKLLIAGASPYLIDYRRRGILSYCKRLKDQKLKKKITFLVNKKQTIKESEKVELINFFKKADFKKILTFYNKYKRIDFSYKGKHIVEVLYEKGILNEINFGIIIELGVGLHQIFSNGKSLYSNSILDGNYFVLSQLLKLKVPSTIKGRSSLEYAFKSKLKNKFIIDILVQMYRFDYLDKDGNNFAHLAVQNNKAELLEELKRMGVNIHATNKQGETPLYILLKTSRSNKKNISSLVTKNENFNLNLEKGDNTGMLLAARWPHVYLKNRTIIKKSGYNSMSKNSKGYTAVRILKNKGIIKENYSDKQLEDVEIKIHKFKSYKKKAKTNLYEEIVELEKIELDYKDTKLENRELNLFIYDSFERYNENKSLAYRLELVKSGVLDNVSEEVIKIKTNIEKNNMKLLEVQLEAINNTSKMKIAKSEYQIYEKKTLETKTKLKEKYNTVNKIILKIRENASVISNDLSQFTEEEIELKNILERMKKGDTETLRQIDKVKDEAKVLKNTIDDKIKVKKRDHQLRLQLAKQNSADSDAEYMKEGRQLNRSRVELARLTEKRNGYIHDIKKNNTDKVSREHAKIHKPNNCTFDRINKDISNIITNINIKISKEEGNKNHHLKLFNVLSIKRATKLNKYEQKRKRLSLNLNNEIKRVRSYYQEKLDDKENRLEDLSLDSLDEYENIRSMVHEIQKEVTAKYGPLIQIEKDWSKLYQIISTIDSKEGKISHLFICPTILRPTSMFCHISKTYGFSNQETGIAKLISPLLSSLSTPLYEIQQIKKKFSSFDKILKYVENLKIKQQENNNLTEDLKIENGKLKKEMNLKLLIEIDESELNQLLYYEKKYLFNKLFLSSGSVVSNKKMKELKLKAQSKDIHINYESFFYKDLLLTDYIPLGFNDLVMENKNYVKVKENEARNILKNWFRKMIKNKINNTSFLRKENESVFVNMIILSGEIFKSTTKDGPISVRIVTSLGIFNIGSKGQLLITHSRDILDFNLISSGELRKRIESILEGLKSSKPLNYNKESLKKDYPTGLVLSLIKEADKIRDIELASELLEYAEVIIKTGTVFSGAGVIAVAALGIPNCALDMYKYYYMDIRSSPLSDIFNKLGCFSVISNQFELNFLENMLKSSFLKKYISILEKNKARFSLEFLFGITGKIDKEVILYFERFSLELIKLIRAKKEEGAPTL